MGERFLVWGGGGHGRVVADVLRACGDEVVGFIDRNPTMAVSSVTPLPVLAETDVIDSPSLPLGATAVALGIGDNAARLAALQQLQVRGIPCPPRVHATAVIGSGVVIESGTVVMAGAVVNACAQLGQAVIVNSGAIVEHDCWVGDGAHLSPGSVLCGAVRVGRQSWVGAAATVIPGIVIGEQVIVGAGSVVIGNFGGPGTLVGNPARVLKTEAST